MNPLVRSVRSYVARMLSIELPSQPLITSGLTQASQSYPVMESMSAFAAFPYVRLAVNAIAQDLSGLPLIAAVQNGDHEEIVSLTSGGAGLPPTAQAAARRVLRTLRKPNPKMSGRALRKQVYTDRLATGNGFVWLPDGTDYLVRVHPAMVTATSDRLGLITAFDMVHLGLKVPFERMLHAADVSWRDDSSAGLGESPIYTLAEDLQAEQSARKITRSQAETGHPAVMATAKNPDAQFSPETMQATADAWERQMRKGNSILFLGSAFEAQAVGLSPKDMAYPQLREANRETVLAFFGVPGTRAATAAANYGTSRQEMRSYWEHIATGAAAEWDEVWSTLAHRLTGDETIRIEHDLSSIEALQVSYTERQLRIQTWVALGADPLDAARYEGFPDAPLRAGGTTGAVDPAGRQSPRVTEPQDPRKAAVLRAVHGYLQGAAARYDAAIQRADGDLGSIQREGDEARRAAVELGAALPAEDALRWAPELAQWADSAALVFAQDAIADGVSRSGLSAMGAYSEQRAQVFADAIVR